MTGRGVAAAVLALGAGTAAVVGWETVPSADTTQPAAATTTPPAASGGALDGATLFRVKGCASCHTGPDSSALVAVGPDLSEAASWAGDRRPGMSAEDYVAESVRSPGAFISPAFSPSGGPTEAMPQLEVSDAELDALVEYLLEG